MFRLNTRRAAVIWNESLPCGGDVVAVEMIRGALVATFVLRPRPDHECAAPGERAAAAFPIEDGRIRAWQQVPPPLADASGVAA